MASAQRREKETHHEDAANRKTTPPPRCLALCAALVVAAPTGAALLPSAAAAMPESVFEGQRLSFGLKRPGKDIYRRSLTYKYRTSGGTAKAGEDYKPATGTVTFSAGVDGARVYIQTFKDDIPEGRETVYLKLYEPKAPRYGGWIQQNGRWVRVETLLPSSRSFGGYIDDCHPRLKARGLCN